MGIPNVDKMLRSLTAKQFNEWYYYSQLEPFSEVRADYRAASIVQILANVNRGKGQKAFSIQDVLLKFEEKEAPQKQTWQQQQAIARAIVMAYNAPAIEG